MEKTLEQINAEFKKSEYGTCAHCREELQFNDDFVDVEQGVCGQSQGYPTCWMKGKKLRYHVECYKGS